jgi:DNA polymerase-3 subunit epsilon
VTGWHEGPLLSLDFETTGVDAHTERAVQVGLAGIRPGLPSLKQQWLLDPGVEVPDGAARIHGITTERCRNDGEQPGPVLLEVRTQVVEHLQQGLPLIAFNAAYDCTLFEAELHRHGLETVTELLGEFAPIVDPFVIDKKLSRRKGKRTLETQAEFYDVRLDGAHDALHDAMCAARVAWRIAQRHPHIATMPLAELHQLQIIWRREQQDSLRAYFDSRGTQHDGCDGHWPIRQQPVGVPA